MRLQLSSERVGEKGKIFKLQEERSRRARLSYDYDPSDPIIATGGETIFTSIRRRGSNLQNEAGYRDDLITFVSEPLERDITIAGSIKLLLRVSSDADDTAFAFTLSEITPDGKAYNMRNSITTLAYRKDLLGKRRKYRAGKRVDAEIVALPIVWTVKAGNRLRIDVQSSLFPEYAVHSNTAGVWAEQAESRIAHQSIFVGGKKRSYLSLPLMKIEDVF